MLSSRVAVVAEGSFTFVTSLDVDDEEVPEPEEEEGAVVAERTVGEVVVAPNAPSSVLVLMVLLDTLDMLSFGLPSILSRSSSSISFTSPAAAVVGGNEEEDCSFCPPMLSLDLAAKDSVFSPFEDWFKVGELDLELPLESEEEAGEEVAEAEELGTEDDDLLSAR